MKHVIRTAALGLAFLSLASCANGPYQASPEALQQRAQAVSRYGTAIVPGQSVGPIRIGMGMDEVQALLGAPDSTSHNPNGVVDQWWYISMNLGVGFTDTATPTVNSVWTEVYTKSDGVTFGEQTWDDGYPVQTAYKTGSGIQLGSSSFDVQRAYGSGYTDPGGDALMMKYGNGISFRVTRSDKRVVAIYVNQE